MSDYFVFFFLPKYRAIKKKNKKQKIKQTKHLKSLKQILNLKCLSKKKKILNLKLLLSLIDKKVRIMLQLQTILQHFYKMLMQSIFY